VIIDKVDCWLFLVISFLSYVWGLGIDRTMKVTHLYVLQEEAAIIVRGVLLLLNLDWAELL